MTIFSWTNNSKIAVDVEFPRSGNGALPAGILMGNWTSGMMLADEEKGV